MTSYRIQVYTASKIRWRPLWEDLAAQWQPEINFTARWIKQPKGPDHNTTFWSDSDKERHWIYDIQDVQRSDCLIAYKTADDSLSGTLVEIGCALGLGKIVYAVGFTPSDSWQSHPLVRSCLTLDSAFYFITGKDPAP